LDGCHAFHATHADLLRRLRRSEESRAAYDRAIGRPRLWSSGQRYFIQPVGHDRNLPFDPCF
jgi:predicted RNA polymerase sigma factor